MAGELSNPLEASMLQQFLTTIAQGSQIITARPTAWAISLHTNSGADESNTAWTATELVTTGTSNYSRQLVTFTLNSTGTAGTNRVENAASVAWTSWGHSTTTSVTYIAVWDSATYLGGNMLFYVDTNNITVANTDVVTINAGQVTLEMQ